MYPNQYCQPCTEPTPCVPAPPPPDCIGEPCEEIVLDTCVRYTGPAIPCLGILPGVNINQVIQTLAARICDCCDGTLPVVNCVVSDWSAWSTCVDGVQTRTRTVIQAPQNGGTACPTLTETQACTPPVVNCVVSAWSSWSTCTDGIQTRTRTIITPASGGGTACPTLTDTQSCNVPVDCVVSAWSSWSSCIDGIETRTRTVTTPASNGGVACPTLIETRSCCTPVDCVVSGWSAWSSCVGGFQTRTRTVVTPASCGGTVCPTLTETQACCVPVDCVVSAWSEWSACEADTRTRTRTVVTPASCGGTVCPVLIETEACTSPICVPVTQFYSDSVDCETVELTFNDAAIGAATNLTVELVSTSAPTVPIQYYDFIVTGTASTYTHTFTGVTAGTYYIKVYKISASGSCEVQTTSSVTVLACTPPPTPCISYTATTTAAEIQTVNYTDCNGVPQQFGIGGIGGLDTHVFCALSDSVTNPPEVNLAEGELCEGNQTEPTCYTVVVPYEELMVGGEMLYFHYTDITAGYVLINTTMLPTQDTGSGLQFAICSISGAPVFRYGVAGPDQPINVISIVMGGPCTASAECFALING